MIYKPREKKKLESSIQREIIKWLDSLQEEKKPVLYIRLVSSSRAGWPDLILCIKGRFVGIELKTLENRQKTSKLQKEKLKKIHQVGGLSFVATSLEEVQKIVLDIMKN